MTSISFVEASQIYVCASHASIRRHRVSVQSLSAYSHALKSLRLLLREEADNDYWREVMWRAYLYRKLMCSAPLAPSHSALRGGELVAQLQRHLRDCEEIAPRVAAPARQLLSSMQSVVSLQVNPLLSAIVDFLDFEDSAGVGVIVAESRLLAPTQEVLRRTPVLEGAEAVHTSELRAGRTFQRLFLTGAAEWYGGGVLSAPRAPVVDVVRYSFVPDHWRPERAFIGSRIDGPSRASEEYLTEEGVADSELDPVEMPLMDVQQFVKKSGGEPVEVSQEIAVAKLVLIEGDLGVFLDADGGSKVFVIDLDSDGEDRVVRLPVASLRPGMFLLLRTEGGGDYVIPVADRVLGTCAASARASLKLWKTVLRARVRDYGPTYVAKELERRGGRGVDANDVRRWMSPVTIGTTSRENFQAVLVYTGLAARSNDLWDLMHRVQVAHKQAGLRIRRLLLDEVEKADLGVLRKHGFLEFELPGQDAGSLTAYRIEEIMRDEVLIAASKLARPLHLGNARWLE